MYVITYFIKGFCYLYYVIINNNPMNTNFSQPSTKQAKLEARRNYLKSFIGKTINTTVTGQVVPGVVKEFREDVYTFEIFVEHEPVQWGNDIFTSGWFFERKDDGFGNHTITKL